jgi:hypothetical protein
MAKKKELRLKKIPLETFLDALDELYAMGVEYVDIVGTLGEDQDTIGLMYCKEYMNKEFLEEFDENIDKFIEEEMIKKDIKLSDDDLNQLT